MSKRLIAALAFGAILAAGGASAAQLYDGVLIPELAQILRAGGLGVTEQTDQGMPFLIVQIPNTEVKLLVSGVGCTAGPRCQGFAVLVPINSGVLTQSVTDTFNRDVPYAHIASTADGHPFMKGGYVAKGGVTDLNLFYDFSAFFAAMTNLGKIASGAIAQNDTPDTDLGAAPTAPGFMAQMAKTFAVAAGKPKLFLNDKAALDELKAQLKP